MPGVSRQAKPQRPAYAASHIPAIPAAYGQRCGRSIREAVVGDLARTGRLVTCARRDLAIPEGRGCCDRCEYCR